MLHEANLFALAEGKKNYTLIKQSVTIALTGVGKYVALMENGRERVLLTRLHDA